MKLRATILWIMALVILGYVNYGAWQMESLRREGEVLFLELAPVDPRSLIQGDYMRLRYAIADEVMVKEVATTGQLVIRRDENGVGSLVRVAPDDVELAAGELLLTYHIRDGRVSVGAESFFFQEGHAERYEEALYAELRVDPASGTALLVGLRDEELEPLGGAVGPEPG